MFRKALKSVHVRPQLAPKPFALPPAIRVRPFQSGSGAGGGSQQGGGGKASRVAFVAVLGFMPIFTAFLGTWQIQRLQWKVEMIDQLESKLNQDPIGLPARIE